MERLRDNDADWGLTRMTYAAQTRRMLRNRVVPLPSRAFGVVVADEHPLALHETASGQFAYQVQRDGVVISLPWVSILGEGMAQ